MKGRTWVLVLFFIAAVLIGGYLAGFRAFDINRRARLFVIEQVSESLGAEFDAESVYLLPWSFGIRNASLKLADNPVRIDIERIRFEFNLLDFVLNRFRFEAGTKQIFIDNPKFTWIRGEDEIQPGTFRLNALPAFSVRDLPETSLMITGGEFVIVRGDSSLVFADGIDGLISGRGRHNITLSVVGRVLSDEENTGLTGALDRDTNAVTLDLTARDCDFSRGNLDVLTGDIVTSAGLLDVNLHFERAGDGLSITGKYHAGGVSFALENSHVSVTDASLEGAVEENRIDFDSATGTILGVTPRLRGRLDLSPRPSLYLEASADSADIGSVMRQLQPDHDEYPGGVLSFSSIIEGALDSLAATVRIESDSLWFGDERLDALSVDVRIENAVMAIDHIDAWYRDFRISGDGDSRRLLAAAPGNLGRDLSLNLDIRRPELPSWRFGVSLDGLVWPDRDEYQTEFTLDIFKRNGDGGYHLFDTVEGSAGWRNGSLTCDVTDGAVSFAGTVSEVTKTPKIDARLTLAAFNPLEYAGASGPDVVINGEGRIMGDTDSLFVDGEYRVALSTHLTALLTGGASVREALDPSRSISFDGALSDIHLRWSRPLFWRVGLDADSTGAALRVVDEEGAALNARIAYDTGALEGAIALDGLPLEWIIDIFRREEFGERGKLTGVAVLGGDIREPFFTTPEPVQVTDLKVGGLDLLAGSCRVSGKIGELLFSGAEISRKGMHIMSADGRWVSGQPFTLDATGRNVELGAVGDIISDVRRVDGSVNYDVVMNFTRRSGTVDGSFEVRDGHFLDVPFDHAGAKLGGGSDGFRATEFTVEKAGVFTGVGEASSGYFWKNSNEAPGLRMTAMLQGDLMRALPSLTGAIEEASGESQLTLTLGGTWQDPVVLEGELYVNDGEIRPGYIVDAVTDINAVLDIDPELQTRSGLLGVRVKSASGTVNDRRLMVRNIHPADSLGAKLIAEKPELISIINSTINLDFGVLGASIENSRNEPVFELNIPGIMRPKEMGTFLLQGEYDNQFLVGAADAGDHLAPYLAGDAVILTGDITYPFLETGDGDGSGSGIAGDIMWDILIRAGSNVNYERETNFAIGSLAGTTVARTEARFDENSEVAVRGRAADGTLAVTGSMRADSGSIEYYGTEFQIERAELEIDTANPVAPATLTARARTVTYDDSTGVETEIFLNVYSVDRNSGRRQRVPGRVQVRSDEEEISQARLIDAGALGVMEIEFTSTNPSDDTQEEILARLGISPGNIGDAAARAFTAGVDNFYFNPILRPFEDVLRKYTRLDVVRFTPSVLGNIMRSQLYGYDRFGPDSDYMLFEQSRIMLGEYVLEDWFLSYRGQYGVGRDYLSRRERGFFHEIGLQYMLENNTRLMLNYNYDDIISKSDRRFEIRHDFEF